MNQIIKESDILCPHCGERSLHRWTGLRNVKGCGITTILDFCECGFYNCTQFRKFEISVDENGPLLHTPHEEYFKRKE